MRIPMLVTFGELTYGTCFRYQNSVYMKVRDVTVPDKFLERNAVCLTTGRLFSMTLEEDVELVSVSIGVKDESDRNRSDNQRN